MLADCERIVQESIDGLGGLDIIINNAVRLSVGLSTNRSGGHSPRKTFLLMKILVAA